MKNLLVLHGALGSAHQFEYLKESFGGEVKVDVLNFSGHGGKTFSNKRFCVEEFANEVAHYITENNLKKVYIFGYSMGGYVALVLAKQYPTLISGIISLATKFLWDEEAAIKENKMLDPAVMEEKVPEYVKMLKTIHGEQQWKELLSKTGTLMTDLAREQTINTQNIADITCKVWVGLGDKDKMVSLSETISIQKALKNSALYILPDTKHPFDMVNREQIIFQISQFLGQSE